MTRQLVHLIVADGGTDRVLVPVIEWALRRQDPQVEILEPEFRKRRGSVEDFVTALPVGEGPMLIFVHRDAENATLGERLSEFDGLLRDDLVPVVPVRMTEAWLLVDPSAVAFAADRPTADVSLPRPSELEEIADPKALLEEKLLEAAGEPSGRRRKRFKRDLTHRRVLVAQRIETFAPLVGVPSFDSFLSRLDEVYPYGPHGRM